MFSYDLSLRLGKKIIFWAKLAVFVGLVAYILYVWKQQPVDWRIVLRQWQAVQHPERYLLGLLVLTPINWGFETLKWQILLQRIEQTSFWDAYRGVLAGVSLGFALPAQLGDTAGRVLSLRSGQRGEAVGASLVSGGMQFYVAIVFGTIAWTHHIAVVPQRNTQAGQWLLVVLISLSAVGIGFGLVRQRLINWLASRPALHRWADYWQVGGLYTDREIELALIVATLRYLVFSIQFYLALQLLGIELPAQLMASSIGLIFLVKTITPAFNLLSDLGVREAASLWVFAPFGLPAPILLMATLTLWIVNILTPVLVGLIWVWKLKISRHI